MVNTIPGNLQSERSSKRHHPQTQPEQCIPRPLHQQQLPSLVRKGHNTQPNPKPDTCQWILHLQILRMAQLNRRNNPEPTDGQRSSNLHRILLPRSNLTANTWLSNRRNTHWHTDWNTLLGMHETKTSQTLNNPSIKSGGAVF